MTTQELMSLAERVERATGADRELDAKIEIAIDPSNNGRVIYGKGRRFYMGGAPDRVPFAVRFGTGTKFGLICQKHSYTASLDAAMTLVPEGWHIRELGEDWKDSRWKARLCARPSESQRRAFDDGRVIGIRSEEATAATSALALCAASLRARASSDAGGRG